MAKDGDLYARVLGFEVVEMEVPPDVMPVDITDISEIVWTPPKEVTANWR
jgi:hypothetical protein